MTAPRRHPTRGFTLLELLIVCVLMVILTLITAQVWRSLSVDGAELTARARLARELRFAVENLSRDMGAAVGATPIAGNRVLICRDWGATPNGVPEWGDPDLMVEYYVDEGKLLRLDQSTGSQLAVAEDVSSFTAENVDASLMRIVVQAQRAGITRELTLMWSRP